MEKGLEGSNTLPYLVLHLQAFSSEETARSDPLTRCQRYEEETFGGGVFGFCNIPLSLRALSHISV